MDGPKYGGKVWNFESKTLKRSSEILIKHRNFFAEGKFDIFSQTLKTFLK